MQKSIAISFLQLASAGNSAAAFAQYVSEDFVHHNPYFKSDAKSLSEAMAENAKQNPNKQFEILRAIEQGDLVSVHSRISFPDKILIISVVHIFRFEHGKIVELWDIGQAAPDNMTNKIGMF